MKIVINSCFGGFSLSPAAVRRMAELQGRECYFFKHDYDSDSYVLASETENSLMITAFDVPNPNEVVRASKPWKQMTTDECRTANENYEKHCLGNRPEDRSESLLVQVVEELGDKASGQCAELTIVEIPDGVDYTIEEYDGNEHIAERHRTWG